MAEMQNFRTALGGFNREDVVHYIEYLNQKHGNLENQLTAEKQAVVSELEQVRQELEAVRTQLAERDSDTSAQEAMEENQQLRDEVAQLKLELAQAKESSAQELEVYRRAERMERAARERSDLIYRQAIAALGEATTVVDNSGVEFGKITERVTADLALLRATVDRSKEALQIATSTMYSIRPTEESQE